VKPIGLRGRSPESVYCFYREVAGRFCDIPFQEVVETEFVLGMRSSFSSQSLVLVGEFCVCVL
jgi:hypothetical protein